MANGVGVVDSDYRGELKVPMVNLGAEAYTIQPASGWHSSASRRCTRRHSCRPTHWMRPPAARAASARRGNDDEEPDLSLRQSAPEGASELIHDGLHHLRQRFRRERSHCTHSGPAGGKAGPGQMPRRGKRPSRAVVLGCDTVVDVGGEVFGKPHSVEDAKRMLRALSGAAHEVHTGVCVSDAYAPRASWTAAR